MITGWRKSFLCALAVLSAALAPVGGAALAPGDPTISQLALKPASSRADGVSDPGATPRAVGDSGANPGAVRDPGATAGEVRIVLAEPDSAVTIGRTGGVTARLQDTDGRVGSVRFRVNGVAGAEILRDPADTAPSFSVKVRPENSTRMSVMVEALDGRGTPVARDLMWLAPLNPYREHVSVRAGTEWVDLIPRESNLHQHPVVMVHPLRSGAMTEDERRFGLNQRPARVLFLVDEEGLADDLPLILGALGAARKPESGIMRDGDEAGVLLVSKKVKVEKDFSDGSLATLLATLKDSSDAAGRGSPGSARPGEPGGTPKERADDPPDLGDLLAWTLESLPEDHVSVCVIVTNGVRWGSYWKRKEVPGTGETDALLTPEDVTRIRALSFAKEIPIRTLAISTADLPIDADPGGHLDFAPLEAKLLESATNEAVAAGSDPARAGAAARARMNRFDPYINQMFDLFSSIGEMTGAGRSVRVSSARKVDLLIAIKETLASHIGRFQRRDFKVFESVSGKKCAPSAQEQLVESAVYRGRDKLILAVTLDESASVQNQREAKAIAEAARYIISQRRPADDCVIVSTFSRGYSPVVFTCLDDPEEAERKVATRVKLSEGTDIFGAAVSATQHMIDVERALRQRPGFLQPGQEVRKVLVIVTDGYQTSDDTPSSGAVSFLKEHDVMLFEAIMPGAPGGTFVGGWSSDVVGRTIPVKAEKEFSPDKLKNDIAGYIESIYWGVRESYRLRYTSAFPEKDRREVCITVANREDLYVSNQGGDSYVSDKDAVTHLLKIARNISNILQKRKAAIRSLGQIGTEFEIAPLLKISSGSEADLRVPAFLAAVDLSRRHDISWRRFEKSLDGMEDVTRIDLIRSIVDRVEAETPDARTDRADVETPIVERILVYFLTHKDAPRPARAEGSESEIAGLAVQADQGARLQALLALGRLDAPLAPATLAQIERLASDPDAGFAAAASRLATDLARRRSAP